MSVGGRVPPPIESERYAQVGGAIRAPTTRRDGKGGADVVTRRFARWMLAGILGSIAPAVAVAQDDAPTAETPADTPAADDATPAEAPAKAPGTVDADTLEVETVDLAEGPPPDQSLQLSAEYLRELRSAEERVHDLKQRVFQSKATLQLLKELVVEGAGRGAALRIRHEHALKKVYDVLEIRYYLDGKSIYRWNAADGGEVPDGVEIRDATIAPGAHALQVVMRVKANGRKVFAYVDDMQADIESSYTLDIEGGAAIDLTVTATQKGGIRKSFMERPTLVYEERREKMALE